MDNLIKISDATIKHLEPYQVFVFGNNMVGQHGGGAAKTALKWGKGHGLHGQTYGIPTKQTPWIHMERRAVKPYVDIFIKFARQHPHLEFLVTEIGCGLAGFKIKEIASLFAEALALPNVKLPLRFVQYLFKNY